VGIRADEGQAGGDAIRSCSNPVQELHRGGRYWATLRAS
jgi:hypothetical protein